MGWFTSSDKDDEGQNPDFFSKFQSNFSSNINSVSRICRQDQEDNKFMVCKIKETKTEKINGENVTKTEEREERIPISNQNSNLSIFKTERDHIHPTNGGFPLDDELKNLDYQMNNALNSFFGGSNMFLNDIFKEMDRAFGRIPHMNYQHENNMENDQFSTISQNTNYSQPQNQIFQQHDNFNKQQYNYNFKKSPKSEKDIFDV